MPRVLLLEDNAIDAHLIKRVLVDNGLQAEFTVAESRAEYLQKLQSDSIDLIISDSGVPWLTALEALHLSRDRHPHSLFLIVSGGIDSQDAAVAKKAGVVEWIPKDELTKLPPIARLALESAVQARSAAGLQQQNVKLQVVSKTVHHLVEAVKQLSQARDLPAIQDIVRRAARAINGADGATFVLRDEQECFYADEDAISPLWKGQRFPMASCISGWAMLNKQAAVVPDITLDSRIPQDAYRPTFVKSMVMVPIRRESPIGAIGNYWATLHEPTEEEVQCIQALADSTSVALANVDFYNQLEKRVAERTAQLQEANQSLEEFSYFVSHDLRAPVRSIGAFAELLEREFKGVIQPQAQRALETIKSSTVSMQAMLESMLTLAHSGTTSIKMENVDMTALAKDAVQIAGEQGSNLANAAMNIKVSRLPSIRGSAVLLRQVWLNLLTNAIKFSANRTNPQIVIGNESTVDEVCYFVRDNGAGFDMTYADRLFNAFQRLHSVHEYAGAGVGLAIVHRIITRHGGRVWATSKIDEGATFYFALPKDNAIIS